MKKFYFSIVLTLLFYSAMTQVVFCPPGAEWHFLNRNGADSYPFERNETVTYSHDSIVGGVSAKVLIHSVFYTLNSESCRITLIKQGGDTVFIRNKFTQNTWQVFYNFNSTQGQSWFNTLSVATISGTVIYNFKTTVDSVSNFTTNSTNFKRMYISLYVYINGYVIPVDKLVITERFGCNRFMFYWSVPNVFFEANYFTQILCYEDSSWPLQQFSNKPCNYSNVLGLNQTTLKNNIITIFPNPVSDVLFLDSEEILANTYVDVSIYNATGKLLKVCHTKMSEQIILGDLTSGLYFVKVNLNEKCIFTSKIIKN